MMINYGATGAATFSQDLSPTMRVAPSVLFSTGYVDGSWTGVTFTASVGGFGGPSASIILVSTNKHVDANNGNFGTLQFSMTADAEL